MTKILNFLRNNWFSVLLVLFIAYKFFNPINIFQTGMSRDYGYDMVGNAMGSPSALKVSSSDSMIYPQPEVAPQTQILDRMTITNSSLSLQVRNVTQSIQMIKDKLTEVKGYVVNTSIDRPEFGENATLQVRVPSDKVEEMVWFMRDLSVKVVNETIDGTDITDQYVDVKTRIERLEATKKRLEEILVSAKDVDDIMNVQRNIFSLQDQIDNYKGSLLYLENSSSTSLVTVYLSTDELGLPYTPSKAWRPEVIVKEAVRSLLGTVQGLGSMMIWLGVYSVIIVPALTVFFVIMLLRKRMGK